MEIAPVSSATPVSGSSRVSEATRATPAPPVPECMSESRHDPIHGRWTIYAPRRGERPNEFATADPAATSSSDCPFCQGQEHVTPAAVWVGRLHDGTFAERPGHVDGTDPGHRHQPHAPFSSDPFLGGGPPHGPAGGPVADASAVREWVGGYGRDGADGERGERWSVRVVPNKFPAVGPAARPGLGHPPRSGALFQSKPLTGGHEVIIDSPCHAGSLTELDVAQVELVFAAYRDRIRHWRSVSGIRYISVFKNVGRDAGASLYHSHGQLIATSAIPTDVARTSERLERYRAMTGCCLHCDLIRAELKEKSRVIAANGSVVAFCPFAGSLPYLVRITTREHQANFDDLADGQIREVARMVRRVLGWLERLQPGIAYNFLLHTMPPRSRRDPDAHHWCLELFPRMTQIAGFEWGSHCMINPVLPEVAAAHYRELARAESPRRPLRSAE